MESIVVVQDFVKKYDDFIAVDNVSFEVEKGSIFGFLGPNGAGKSTTINTLCTILDKTSGMLLIDGKDVDRHKDEVRSVIGVVFQEPTLDVKMTVEENLKMHGYFYGLPTMVMEERIQFVLDLVDLAEWRKEMVNRLSGGMKRRVEIARSLLHFPKILFLDEPTTGLDPQTRANIWDYLINLQKETDMTIFLTTHYMDEAEICDHVAIMDCGSIIAFDTPETLKEQFTKDYARMKTKDGQQLASLLEEYEMAFTKNGNVFSIELTELSDFAKVISEHRSIIQDLEMKKGTLNDYMVDGKIVGEKRLGKYKRENEDEKQREERLSKWLMERGF